MSRRYAYVCDAQGCTVFVRSARPALFVHPAHKGKHWCLRHYPYDLCRNPHCGRKMRPYDSPKAEHPGTVAKGGEGLCTSCWKHYSLYGTMRKPRNSRGWGLDGEGIPKVTLTSSQQT